MAGSLIRQTIRRHLKGNQLRLEGSRWQLGVDFLTKHETKTCSIKMPRTSLQMQCCPRSPGPDSTFLGKFQAHLCQQHVRAVADRPWGAIRTHSPALHVELGWRARVGPDGAGRHIGHKPPLQRFHGEEEVVFDAVARHHKNVAAHWRARMGAGTLYRAREGPEEGWGGDAPPVPSDVCALDFLGQKQ